MRPTRSAPCHACVALQVKEYCERQWGKILAGRVSVSDFVFAKEVRLVGCGAEGSVAVPPGKGEAA